MSDSVIDAIIEERNAKLYEINKSYDHNCEVCCATEIRKKMTKAGWRFWEQCMICGRMIKMVKKDSVKDDPKIADTEMRDKWMESREREKQWVFTEYKAKIDTEYERRRYNYHEYLRSDKWREIRHAVLERDRHLCQGCLATEATCVHHKTYDNIYDELAFQLVSLCKNCHDKLHDRG